MAQEKNRKDWQRTPLGKKEGTRRRVDLTRDDVRSSESQKWPGCPPREGGGSRGPGNVNDRVLPGFKGKPNMPANRRITRREAFRRRRRREGGKGD